MKKLTSLPDQAQNDKARKEADTGMTKGQHSPQKNFAKKSFKRQNLSAVQISDSDLSGANFEKTNLENACFTASTFYKAVFKKANLRFADLSGAKLIRANLQKADLHGANLQGADLRKADLRDAILVEANLNKADFMGAKYNRHTHFPENFQPHKRGLRKIGWVQSDFDQIRQAFFQIILVIIGGVIGTATTLLLRDETWRSNLQYWINWGWQIILHKLHGFY